METRANDKGLHPGWWTAILVLIVVGLIAMTVILFSGTFRRFVPVTLTSDRAGLVMEPGAKVKLRGVEVGQVKTIAAGPDDVSLQLDLYPDQVQYIPANVDARIEATTAFGAKYVDLILPDQPSSDHVKAGAVVRSRNVSTEVNTVFQNLDTLIDAVDPMKLNAVISALADGVQGQGQRMGEAITASNDVLLAINPRSETVRQDFQSFGKFSDAYSRAAKDIVNVLGAATTTSATIVDNAHALDALLLSATGFANVGNDTLSKNNPNLIRAVNDLLPTTDLLLKYTPSFTCLLVGSKALLDDGWYKALGGNGRSAVLDAALMLGDDPYRYPDNLPVVGARGGPGGKPGCGSLPDASKDWPVRYLITNTGWGTGMDVRPNPGIGFPGYANYLPTTRANPEPPSIRYPGGPAPGPIPYPGAPPYGAPEYGPDGTPLYPGLPPAPPPGAPREPGPTPGSEPFVVPYPAQMQPTPTPPLPDAAVPAP